MAVAKAPKISPGNRRFGRPILPVKKGFRIPAFGVTIYPQDEKLILESAPLL